MTIVDDIIKKHGEIVKEGLDISKHEPVLIPVSPAIDIALGGGIPEGTFTVLNGPPKGGKTLLALWVAANAQKHYDKKLCPDGRNIYYFGVEGRLKPRDLNGIPHLDLSKFKQIISEPGNLLTGEKILDAADMIIRSEPGCIVIIDSFSALCTETEMTSDMDKQQMASGAKLLAKFCRKIANAIAINRIVLIGITHMMGNPGYGAPSKEKGGFAIGYQADIKLRIKDFKLESPDDKGSATGQEVNWKVDFSAIGPPGGSATSYITFGKGINEAKELATLGEDLGLIKKKGAWYKFVDTDNYPDKNFQGKDAIAEFLESEAKIRDKLRKEIYKVCGID